MERRKKYDKQFKIEAVKYYEESNKTRKEVEKELGITSGCLSHWKRELAEQGSEAFPGNGNLPDSEKEIARLRRELEIVREERDILKKAISIFSKTPGQR